MKMAGTTGGWSGGVSGKRGALPRAERKDGGLGPRAECGECMAAEVFDGEFYCDLKEDRLACPHDLRDQKAAAEAAARVKAREEKEARRAAKVARQARSKGQAGGAPVPATRETKPLAAEDETARASAEGLTTEGTEKKETKGEEATMDERKCENPECGKTLPAEAHKNARYCSKKCMSRAWYLRKIGGAKKAKKAQGSFAALRTGSSTRAAKDKKPAALAQDDSRKKTNLAHGNGSNGDGAVATICVTEERLNHFLLSLPIETKAEIASQWLGGR